MRTELTDQQRLREQHRLKYKTNPNEGMRCRWKPGGRNTAEGGGRRAGKHQREKGKANEGGAEVQCRCAGEADRGENSGNRAGRGSSD